MSERSPIATEANKLGRYSIFEKLGEGGMGEVFLATRDGVPCVLKTLRREAARDEVAVARFKREAEIGARVRHRNVASVLRSGYEDGVFAIELELVRGKDLRTLAHSLLAEQRLLPYPISIAAILGVLDGLEHIHGLADDQGRPLGVVHRDLSLRNLMLGYDGIPKIIDFGVARAELDDFRTRPGVVPGTLRFVSPELARGEAVDHRSDLYAVGLVLYELLCGAPVVPPGGDPLSTIRSVIEGAPTPLHLANPDIPQTLSAVVMKALAKDREARWQSAAELKEAITRAAPTWAAIESSLIGTFLRIWFKEDAQRADAFVDALEASRALVEPPGTEDDDALTAVRPMSGFEEAQEELASTTGLRLPTRQRRISTATPEERLLPSQALMHPRSTLRPATWLIAAVTALAVSGISVAALRRPYPVKQIPLASTPGPPVTAIQAKAAESAAPREEVQPEPHVAAKPTPRRAAQPKLLSPKATPNPAAAPRPPSKLAALSAALRDSKAHPLSQDPSFQPFVDEVTARARGLSDRQRRTVMSQLDLLIDTGEVARLRPILEALDPAALAPAFPRESAQ